MAMDFKSRKRLDDNAALVEYVGVNAIADKFLSKDNLVKARKRAKERFGCPFVKNRTHTKKRRGGGTVGPEG